MRHVRVSPSEVVFLKGVIDAHDGLAQVFAESGGELVVAAPASRAQELDLLLDDLLLELGAARASTAGAPPSRTLTRRGCG